jgi:nucleosome-remodeling factor subunit BPTF
MHTLFCLDLNPTLISKAYKGGIKIEHRPILGKSNTLRRNVQGEGLPFPFPVPLAFRTRTTKKKSLLIISRAVIKRMARQGGLNASQYLPGFNKQAKSNTTAWPYPCPRPLFDHCWRYLTLNASTYHALALSFRIMFSCIRWAEMQEDEGVSAKFKSTNYAAKF